MKCGERRRNDRREEKLATESAKLTSFHHSSNARKLGELRAKVFQDLCVTNKKVKRNVMRLGMSQSLRSFNHVQGECRSKLVSSSSIRLALAAIDKPRFERFRAMRKLGIQLVIGEAADRISIVYSLYLHKAAGASFLPTPLLCIDAALALLSSTPSTIVCLLSSLCP